MARRQRTVVGSVEATAVRLMEESETAHENGEGYAKITAENAEDSETHHGPFGGSAGCVQMEGSFHTEEGLLHLQHPH